MMKSGKSLGRVGAVLVVVSAAIAAALVGGASTGRATTNFDITLSPVLGTTGQDIAQVSYGGKIGYSLHIKNADTSNTQHVSVVVASNLATFSDSDNASCILNSKDSQMICTPFGGTLAAGQEFNVNLRFTAPATGPVDGEKVKTCASITVSAQTVGGKKNGNSGTTIANTCPTGFDDPGAVVTNIVENTTKDDTYLHKHEHAATGNLSLPDHPQNFGLDTPLDKLFGDPFGIAVSIHDVLGAPAECTSNSTTDCFGAETVLKIPTASSVTIAGNPFYNGTLLNPFNPYSWTMNAQYPQGSNFKLHGIYHIEDGGAFKQLLKCDDPLVGGAPNVTYPLCYDTLDQITNKRMLIATGRGLENGGLGWN
jgi:hypothetical protein